jgi:hypothetical protein
VLYTDKKGKKIFLIKKKIKKGAVAKSYMTNGIFPYIIGSPSSYDFATAPLLNWMA